MLAPRDANGNNPATTLMTAVTTLLSSRLLRVHFASEEEIRSVACDAIEIYYYVVGFYADLYRILNGSHNLVVNLYLRFWIFMSLGSQPSLHS
jgi:hypothetical protein